MRHRTTLLIISTIFKDIYQCSQLLGNSANIFLCPYPKSLIHIPNCFGHLHNVYFNPKFFWTHAKMLCSNLICIFSGVLGSNPGCWKKIIEFLKISNHLVNNSIVRPPKCSSFICWPSYWIINCLPKSSVFTSPCHLSSFLYCRMSQEM